ncbi:phage integrase family protein [Burkholderia pseudomallei]|nr:phage integrase family protein [Burkholderia pseudomallei]
MASFQKMKTGWRAQIDRRGVRASQVFDTKAKAVAWAGEVEAAILNGTYRDSKAPPSAGQLTVGGLFERFMRNVSPKRHKPKWEMNRITWFIREFPTLAAVPLLDVTPKHFADWRDERLEFVEGSTVTRDMGFFSVIFTTARDEWGLIQASPLTKVRRPKSPEGRDRRISAEEEEKLLIALGYERDETPTTISARVAAVWLFAIETGARAGEIVGLTWDRVFLSQKKVHFNKTKMGRARDVALSPRAIELIQQVASLRDKAEKQDSVFKVTSSQVDSLYRKARDRCEIENLHFHDTRHEACTRLAKHLPMLDLARMLGIKDLKILMVYYNETATAMAERLATAA